MSFFQYRNLSQRRKFIFRVIFDFIGVILVASAALAIKFRAEPNHRGFFCDDESIRYPILPDTISMKLTASVGIVLPLIVVVVVEYFLRENKVGIVSLNKSNVRDRSWIGAAYHTSAVFIFGLAASLFLTEVGKFTIGRLRPYFLTICNPDMTKLNCSVGYITANVCTSNKTFEMMDARLSFPSGHSSFAMYCMMYLIMYIQARISCDAIIFLKPFMQLVFFSMGFYTCLSRVSDHKHHWSDVFAGAALGMSVCVCVIVSLADFGHDLWEKKKVIGTEYEALVRSGNHTHGGSDSAYYGESQADSFST